MQISGAKFQDYVCRRGRIWSVAIWSLLGIWDLGFGLSPAALAGTTINLSTNVVVSSIKHFGINVGNVDYYDSGQVMKELLFQNPGFEGLLYQSVIWIGASGNSATNAVENGPSNGWPSGFWNGATYEFIYGAAKGRTGTVITSINPYSTGGNTNGTSYIFADSGTVPASGDYMILHKSFTGDDGVAGNNGSAFSGWNTNLGGGATITTELADLPSDTLGRQCVRLTANTSTNQYATLIGPFDTWAGVSFVQVNGQYQLSFKAKGAGGNNQLAVRLRRGSGTYWINATFQLTNSWQNYSTNFSASEDGTAVGGVALQFTTWSGNAALIDDVSLHQTDSSPANTTSMRDAVINALTNFAPSILRIPGNWSRLGDSLDNALAPPFGRQRNYYSEYGTQQNTIAMSLHEFLQAAEFIGAEPWYTFPVTFSTQEIANLMEYLGGPTNTAYGGIRASLGHPAPWTNSLPKIHLEFGNENWNPGYRGGCISDPTALGTRAGELFGIIKSSPYYSTGKFDCVLGEQWVVPARVLATHNACANHDTMTVAGYMANTINSYATAEQLYSSVFAEPEWWSTPGGYIYQDYTNILHSSRPVPLSVYEVNINVPNGTIAGSQSALDAYCPSLGAGLAVADHMLMMLREVKARDQGLFALGGYEALNTSNKYARVWGVTLDMGVTNRKRPQYLACQLANQALAGNMIATAHTGDDPTWSVTNVNTITCTNAHYLQSYAFANGVTNSLIVFNLQRTNALNVNFTGANPPSGNVVMQRLTSANITDNNESSQVIVTTVQTLTNANPAASLSLPPYSMTLFQWQPALVITNLSPLTTGDVGVSYSQTLIAVNGMPPYSWSVAGGALPGGLSLSSAGLISGTPTAAGTFNFTAQVTDGASATATQAFALTVVVPTPPTVSISRATGQSGNTTSASLQFAIVFSEAVNGFGAGAVTIGGAAGASQVAVSGSGKTYTVIVSGMTQSGTVTLSVVAGTVTSVVTGLGNAASTAADAGYNYELPPPSNTLLAYDDFNIATNATPVPPFLNGVATGTNWSGAWVVQGFSATNYPDGYKIGATNGLSFGSLRTTGNYAFGGSYINYWPAGRYLDTTAFPSWTFNNSGTNVIGLAGTELWMSVLMRKANASDGKQAFVGLHSDTIAYSSPGNSRLGVGYMPGPSDSGGQHYWTLAVRNAANALDYTRSNVQITNGAVVLLALRMRFNASGTNGIFDLFVNPSTLGGSMPSIPNATWTSTTNIFFRGLLFTGQDAANSMAVDEIRFGDTYAAVTPLSGAGTLLFSGSSYSANEDGGSETIFVTRAGGNSGTVSVDYATSNGTAHAGTNYTAASGTLTWADGDDSTKSFTISVLDDGFYKGNAGFTVALSNPTGGGAVGPATTVTILETDWPPAITTASPLPAGTVGASYSQTLGATNGAPPYAWAVTGGTLPGGLTLGTNGLISGTPTAAGTFNFTAQVTDTAPASSSSNFALTINPAPALLSAVSRKTHGSAGTFDLPLTLDPTSNATVEPRLGGPTTLIFNFNTNVAAAGGVLNAGSFSLTNVTYSAASISSSNLTLNLTNAVDQSLVTVVLSGITDLAGNPLAGTNAVRISSLYGDVNQSGAVNVVDMQKVKNNLLQGLTSANFLCDVNCNGGINVADLQQIKNNLLHAVSLSIGTDGSSLSILSGVSSGTSSSLTALPAATLSQAVSAPGLAWSTGGDEVWTPTIAQDGSSAAWSGKIGDLNVSWVETTVSGPGTLSFQWMVSSELNGDLLTFSIDGVDQPGRISGEAGWQTLTYQIPAGPHRLTWTYAKNAALAAGLDAGWLRHVVYQ